MTAPNPSPEQPVTLVVEEKKSRFQELRTNHPRAARVVGIFAALIAAVGVILAVKSRKKDNSDLDSANALAGEFESGPETPEVTVA